MRKYENLYGDLSAGSGWGALARDEEYAATFMNEFQDRLMYGTDICSSSGKLPAPLKEFMIKLRDEGKISEAVFQKIARENAIRVLSLEDIVRQ
jgi:predicted TIM-barrel fold metal-dependent hydrolase